MGGNWSSGRGDARCDEEDLRQIIALQLERKNGFYQSLVNNRIPFCFVTEEAREFILCKVHRKTGAREIDNLIEKYIFNELADKLPEDVDLSG